MPSEDSDRSSLAARDLAISPNEGDCAMATWKVTGIVVEMGSDWRHEHITHLLLEDQYWVKRDEAAANILGRTGDRYHTLVHGYRADVIVVGCPVCGFSRYLRTAADATTANNLLSLPKYPKAA
jgi:hypothetical protein